MAVERYLQCAVGRSVGRSSLWQGHLCGHCEIGGGASGDGDGMVLV